MNEDDTYRKLRRLPIEEMQEKWKEHSKNFGFRTEFDKLTEHGMIMAFLKEHGWTMEDYLNASLCNRVDALLADAIKGIEHEISSILKNPLVNYVYPNVKISIVIDKDPKKEAE